MNTKELATRIRSAGFWNTVIRPAEYVADRVSVAKLYPIVEKCVVEIRGWDFPHLDRRKPPMPGQNSIKQLTEWEHHAEIWEFYQSGQFVMLDAMKYDWRDRSGWWPADDKWKRGSQLDVMDAFFTLVEIYEFAARLSSSEAGGDAMNVEVTVGGLEGRVLVLDSPRRLGLSWSNAANIPILHLKPTNIDREQLLADPIAPAVVAANELFTRFGREFPAESMRDWLRDLHR